MKYILIILSVVLLMVSCQKNPTCSNARICVKNIGTDTISYEWNSSFFTKHLNPGEETCQNVGEISGGSYYITYFNSSKGNYAIKVTECDQKQEIK